MDLTVDTIYSTVTQFPPRPFDKDLYKHFTKKSPDSFWKARANPGWSGATKFLSDKTFRLPTGLLHELEAWAAKEGITVNKTDKRKLPPLAHPQVEEDFLPDIKLYDYQLAAINAALAEGRGLLEVATGGGKCVTMDTIVDIEDHGPMAIGIFFKDIPFDVVVPVHEVFRVKTLSGYQQVQWFYKSSPRDIISVNDGSLKGVEEHRVLLSNGSYQTLGNLQAGAEIVKAIDDPAVEFFLASIGIKDFQELFDRDIEVPEELIPKLEKLFHLSRC